MRLIYTIYTIDICCVQEFEKVFQCIDKIRAMRYDYFVL